MPRIVFIITYMGKFLWYFPYFLHACRYNPTVDFLIFTDHNDPNLELPSNVKMIPCSIEQFKAEAAKTLGFDVAVESGYKLCDFKPAYGSERKRYTKPSSFQLSVFTPPLKGAGGCERGRGKIIIYKFK